MNMQRNMRQPPTRSDICSLPLPPRRIGILLIPLPFCIPVSLTSPCFFLYFMRWLSGFAALHRDRSARCGGSVQVIMKCLSGGHRPGTINAALSPRRRVPSSFHLHPNSCLHVIHSQRAGMVAVALRNQQQGGWSCNGLCSTGRFSILIG